MRLLIATLVLATCAHCGPEPEQPFVCRTRCGVVYENWPSPASDWSCSRAQQLEGYMLSDFTKVNDVRFQAACELITDWHVRFMKGDSFKSKDFSDGKVALLGLTDCDTQSTQLAALPAESGVMAHEMAHAVQSCQPNRCAYTNEDASHFCWDTNMVFESVIQVMQDLKDNPVPPEYP